MSRLTRISILLAVCFALDKGLAILRQVVIARQFGLSSELDAFNVANNIPDLLFALISGGALAIAFIPVLSEVLTLEGRQAAWTLFSNIANLAFLITAALAVIVAFLAVPLVHGELGIAPGFEADQQALVVDLMRLNLVATLIFSISGLVMAGLQANQHFLLPAVAPLLYNLGQIFGALILAPEIGYRILGIQLPAFGLGVHGLVFGVIIGALLHIGIQVPGLLKFQFHWSPILQLHNPSVQKVLRLMGPRLVTMLCVQLIFLVRDNLASRLAEGAVTALTYGWMLQQVPETLIGTAIGTAILPTLAELFSQQDRLNYQAVIERAVRVLVALTIPIGVILALGLRPLVAFAFGFDAAGTDLIMWVTRGFLLGLVGHCLLEVAARSFYAQQNAILPLIAAVINVVIYISLGSVLYRVLGAPGISLTDSIAFTSQAVLLLYLLNRRFDEKIRVSATLLRSLAAALLAAGVVAGVVWLSAGRYPLVAGILAMGLGALAALPLVWREVRILVRL
ncbi:MAG: murein biosynthesis integral membrane protein MurJ [Anaerolineaceae bacterium]|nr:murein biosynthesis integral membrane protein MurJ [Anaerolineaceae bacterium]